jgi:hypothetical protein
MSWLRPKRRSQKRRTAKRKISGKTVTLWCAVVGTVTSVLAFGLTDGKQLIESATANGKGPEGSVVVTQEYVINTAEPAEAVNEGTRVQTLTSSPTVEATVFNKTAHRVLIEQARVSIEAYETLRLCFSQGGGPLPQPNPYVIHLATNPLPTERVVETPMHEQIGPEEVDRIALRFGADIAGAGGYALYLLHIQLYVYGEKRDLDLGRFALSAPGRIPTFEGYLPDENSFLQEFTTGSFKAAHLQTTWCLKHNLASLHQILDNSARRAPELALFDQPVLASQWGQLQDHLPPRHAAIRLLEEDGGPEDAGDAVYAAEQTKDPGFEARIRKQASQQLLGWASKDLGTVEPAIVEQLVREALAMWSSERGRLLLREVQQSLAHSSPLR